ncbi:MAG: VCBS repeat-containing protein [Cyclobacteriaceae bacterium]|nr:VCBS repeat-containing protein [Cyclobacteriaceae bacterium]
MNLHFTIAIIALGVIATGCGKVDTYFHEIIIDAAAPDQLWMKTIGDINNDGKTDILVGGNADGGLVAYLGPDWKKQIIDASLHVSTSAKVCDMDRNNIADVVVVTHQAIVWLSGPDWTVHLIDSIDAHDVEVDDFDNDGLLDVIARNQGAFGGDGGHTLFFYYQDAYGNWIKYQREISDGEGLKMADLNHDQKMDIVTNGYWFENRGNREDWIEHKFTDTWTWPNTFIEVVDMNKDGLPDILYSPAELAGSFYHISWFEAPTDPARIWKEHIVADTVETIVHSIRAADLNADGNMDIIIAEMQQGADPDEVAIFYNEGSDAWEKQVISTGGSHSMVLHDFDGDGDIDAIGANFAERILKMWVNESQH